MHEEILFGKQNNIKPLKIHNNCTHWRPAYIKENTHPSDYICDDSLDRNMPDAKVIDD